MLNASLVSVFNTEWEDILIVGKDVEMFPKI